MSCDWNPKENRAAYEDEEHAEASWVVGRADGWHLCDDCEKLPRFKQFRYRHRLKKVKKNAAE